MQNSLGGLLPIETSYISSRKADIADFESRMPFLLYEKLLSVLEPCL